MFLSLRTVGSEEGKMAVQTTLVVGQEQLAQDVVTDQLGDIDSTDAVVWTVDNAAVCSVTAQDPLGRSAMLIALSAGTANVTAACGAASAQITVTVNAPSAETITITLGAAQNVPAAAPAPASGSAS
jgi:hypothetical protein